MVISIKELVYRGQNKRGGFRLLRGKLKVMFCSFILGILLSIGVAAYAVTSDWYDIGTVYGYPYRNQAEAFLTGGGVQATTYIERSTAGNVPSGYLGAQAFMYNSSGAIYNASNWVYNTSTVHGLYQVLPSGGINGQYYYSKGLTQVWNGNGYNQYSTYRTPNVLCQ
ncbi:hypothetical protein Psfp_01688 [Pelotomaculum sp. FP]|nr:hypothetical protein Psfp_01688 [Pelotomaculum sp. FP]